MLEIRKTPLGKERTVHQKMKARRTANRTIVFVAVVLALIVVAGIVYVWYMSRYPNQITQPVVTTQPPQTIKPYTPDPNAPVGIVEQSFSGSVTLGSAASIAVKTTPGAACQITVRTPTEPLSDLSLVPKIADEYGMVDWSWKVPKDIVPAKWPVEITCANEAKKSGFYRAYLEITK